MKNAAFVATWTVFTVLTIFISSCGGSQSPFRGMPFGDAPRVPVEETDSSVDPGTTLDTLSYFSMSVAGGPCLAASINDLASYLRIYQRPSIECSSRRPLFVISKGKGWVWSSESIFVDEGWLKGLDEVWYTENGQVKDIRIFRDNASGRKGVKMLPLRLNAEGESWDIEPYVDEWWTDAAGKPSCNGVNPNPAAGLSYHAEAHPVLLRNWMQDRRPSSRDPNVWHDVHVIKLIDYWGKNQKEYYYYGRWTNPATGRQESLGWVKWELYEGQRKEDEINYRYLVDCNVIVPCMTCPDP